MYIQQKNCSFFMQTENFNYKYPLVLDRFMHLSARTYAQSSTKVNARSYIVHRNKKILKTNIFRIKRRFMTICIVAQA